jgi:hypothetical protein
VQGSCLRRVAVEFMIHLCDPRYHQHNQYLSGEASWLQVGPATARFRIKSMRR